MEYVDIGTQYNMNDESKEEAIKEAIVYREVRKKAWDYDPAQKELGAHILELKTLKDHVKEKVEADIQLPETATSLKGLVKKAIEESKTKYELKTSKVTYRWDSNNIKKKEFSNIRDYEKQATDVLDKNIQKHLEKNARLNQIV